MAKACYDGVKYLETQKLLDAANTLNSCIDDYNEIIKRIKDSSDKLMDNWFGEGKKAFEKDYNTIFRQLSDVGDIMLDLYDSLVDADATYVQTDEDLAKNMTMSE